MSEGDIVFQKAEERYLEGKPLSAEESACMAKALASSAPRSRSIACGALLRDSATPTEQRANARETLLKLCEDLHDESEWSEVSITLLLIPFEELRAPSVRRFVEKLMKSRRFTLRANALAVLERYATTGDHTAVDLIREATNDPDEKVRKSALSKLRRLEP